MNFINCLLDVTDDSDISEVGFADAIKTQACLLSGINPEEITD
jgi:hypothetical protein